MDNTRVQLRRRPVGLPAPEDFELATGPMPLAGPGEIRVQVLYLSIDPALRPRMNERSAYAGPIDIGGLIPSPAIGVVLDSNSPLFAPGDHVFGFFGWQLYAVALAQDLRRIDPALAPLPQWMSLLGLSSFTAWVGLLELGRPNAGETVVVSAASGATGSVAGQLAGIAGARAVGIAGGPQKCRYVVDELGFDACVDYRAPDFEAQLDRVCPKGVDVDFENVGGSVLKAVFARMNQGGRVIICGLVSEYSLPDWPPGPSLWPTVYKSLRIEGFRASNHFHKIPEFVNKALDWAAQGKLRHREHTYEGIESAPQAFVSMLAGQHKGKVMVRVASEPTTQSH